MTRFRWVLPALVIAVAASAEATAQRDEPPPFVLLHVDHVDPARVAEYEAGTSAWVAAFAEAGLGADWHWFAAHSTFAYIYISALPNYSFLDTVAAREAAMAEALGEERLNELTRTMEYVDTHSTEISKHLPEMSHVPDGLDDSVNAFLRVGVYTVRPALDDDFRSLVMRIKDAVARTEGALGFNTYEMQFGAGSYAFVTEAPDAAAFYGQPQTAAVLARIYGAAEAERLLAAWARCVVSFETRDYTIRPDLSYLGAPSAATTQPAASPPPL